MAEAIKWINLEGEGHWFFYAYPAALLCLLIWFKGRRASFLIPGLLITVVILNPVFVRKWNELGLYAYWRILWIIPVVPVLAAVVPSVTEKMALIQGKDGKNKQTVFSGKIAVAVLGTAAICFGGTFLYRGNGGVFAEAGNTAKVPSYVVQIADRILELESEHPRVIVQSPIGVYLRQYTGEIDTMFGRDLDGYIYSSGESDTARTVDKVLDDPQGDLSEVARVMANDSYEYLVMDAEGRQEKITDTGLEWIDSVAGYGIYKSDAAPTVLKERNELGQVVSVTTVDETGAPVNGDGGYSTAAYAYDDNGNTIREFRTDTEGQGVADGNGRAGYEREYDRRSHLLMERTIGPDGTAVENNLGYAEVRREYKGNNIIRESYYNAAGEPVNRKDTRYASVTMAYDASNNRIMERYYDAGGEPVKASAGYAAVKRTYDQRRLTGEAYFGVDDEPVSVARGYCSLKRSYDGAGNMISEAYYDASGSPVNSINGFAAIAYGYDAEKIIVLQRFLDAEGVPVITGSGYAEVHRDYAGKKLIREEYYGADEKAYKQPAGYAAMEQVWDGDVLVSRTYLGSDGTPMNRVDGYAKAVWEKGENCTDVRFYDKDGAEIEITGLNLARNVKAGEDGWSDWLMPSYNAVNSCQYIGDTNLGEKKDGDIYTCTMEIEFRNVTATEGQTLRFWTQGAQDGRWSTGNVWNGSLVNLSEAPEDGVYRYTSTAAVSGDMLNVSRFDVGFRCDYWASGMYRVRFVKIEKGDTAGEWSPGL